MASTVEPRRRGRPSLVRKAHGLMARERMFPAGSRALVMVSGGQDSLALLHLLASGRAGRVGPASLHALHINHHLRGPESDRDEALVVEACARMAVELTVVHRPVDKGLGNVQEEARDARRTTAVEVAAEQACDRMALGHTADDQVETMLYRLGRYGGLAAFAGMAPCDPPWVRPLLSCRRSETAAYCEEHELEFARDRGNAYPGYARTAIRESVLPAWEGALPGAVAAACRAAEVAAELGGLAEEVLGEAAVSVGAGTAGIGEAEGLSVAGLQGLTPAVRRLVLHRWLEARARPAAARASRHAGGGRRPRAGAAAPPPAAVLAVEALLPLAGSAERALGGGWRACREYDRLFLERRALAAASALRDALPGTVPLTVPGEARWGDHVVRAEPVERYTAPDIEKEAYLDADSLDGPLEVRGPRPGDRLRPLGARGKRKLQDVFVDLRVPATKRAGLPLVVCKERIVWVCGLVVAEEGRIGADTMRIVRLSLCPGGGVDEPVGQGGDGEDGQE